MVWRFWHAGKESRAGDTYHGRHRRRDGHRNHHPSERDLRVTSVPSLILRIGGRWGQGRAPGAAYEGQHAYECFDPAWQSPGEPPHSHSYRTSLKARAKVLDFVQSGGGGTAGPTRSRCSAFPLGRGMPCWRWEVRIGSSGLHRDDAIECFSTEHERHAADPPAS